MILLFDGFGLVLIVWFDCCFADKLTGLLGFGVLVWWYVGFCFGVGFYGELGFVVVLGLVWFYLVYLCFADWLVLVDCFVIA